MHYFVIMDGPQVELVPSVQQSVFEGQQLRVRRRAEHKEQRPCKVQRSCNNATASGLWQVRSLAREGEKCLIFSAVLVF